MLYMQSFLKLWEQHTDDRQPCLKIVCQYRQDCGFKNQNVYWVNEYSVTSLFLNCGYFIEILHIQMARKL
jgi:hypothetical protein